MVSMGIDQLERFFGFFDLVADISIGVRRTAAINHNGMVDDTSLP